MKQLLIVFIVVLTIITGYLLFWPTNAEPMAWQAQPAPKLEGRFAANQRLANIERYGQVSAVGPEHLLIDGVGRIYTGTVDGRVLRFDKLDTKPVELVNTGGRPLGMAFAPDNSIIIADAKKGLLRLDLNNNLSVLMDNWEGKPFLFVDDVAVTTTGMVYFSDATQRWSYAFAADDVVENQTTGRIYQYDLNTGQASIAMQGLAFANGVALDADEQSIFVTETSRYRIHRHWIDGPKQGQTEVFADNLPGFPDNISFYRSSSGEATIWVALFAPRNSILDALAEQPFLRKALFRLPETLKPKPANMSFALGFNMAGQVTHNLQYDDPEAYAPVTMATEHAGWLYLGSLSANGFARYKLPSPLGYAQQ